MSALQHPFVVNLRAYSVNPFTLVLELIRFGDLYKFIHSDKNPIMELNMKIALDISIGMQFLHGYEPPAIHRDLKSLNVLLYSLNENDPVVAKVADFGLSSLLFNTALREESRSRAVVNPTWLAPEIISEQGYSIKSDVYAYGIILNEILTRKHPFDEYAPRFMSDTEELIVSGKRPSYPTSSPQPYVALMEDCWNQIPEKRPTFKEITKRLFTMMTSLAPKLDLSLPIYASILK